MAMDEPGTVLANPLRTTHAAADAAVPPAGERRLIRAMLRPYRGWILLVVAMMLVETAMTLAAPWPLKVVLDSVLGAHPPPGWLEALKVVPVDGGKLEIGRASCRERVSRCV